MRDTQNTTNNKQQTAARGARLMFAAAAVLFFALGAKGDAAQAEDARGFLYSEWLRGGGYEVALSSRQPQTAHGFGAQRLWRKTAAEFGANLNLNLNTAVDLRDWRMSQWFGDSLSRAFSDALGNELMRLPFVREVGVDLQTPLGGREGMFAARVVGSLRDAEDEAAGWQLRFYGGDVEGANFGLFRRVATNGVLLGANVFVDYQNENEGDFWRGSIGGEWRWQYGAAAFNFYRPFNDVRRFAGGYAYNRAGFDARLLVHIPGVERISARGDYARWHGRFGDKNQNEFSYGLELRPLDDLNIALRYDTGGDFGAELSYSRAINEFANQLPRRYHSFDAREHFLDAVRREYGQRIVRKTAAPALALANEESQTQIIAKDAKEMTVSFFGDVASVSAAGGSVPQTIYALTNAQVSVTIENGAVRAMPLTAGIVTATLITENNNANTAAATTFLTLRARYQTRIALESLYWQYRRPSEFFVNIPAGYSSPVARGLSENLSQARLMAVGGADDSLTASVTPREMFGNIVGDIGARRYAGIVLLSAAAGELLTATIIAHGGERGDLYFASTAFLTVGAGLPFSLSLQAAQPLSFSRHLRIDAIATIRGVGGVSPYIITEIRTQGAAASSGGLLWYSANRSGAHTITLKASARDSYGYVSPVSPTFSFGAQTASLTVTITAHAYEMTLLFAPSRASLPAGATAIAGTARATLGFERGGYAYSLMPPPARLASLWFGEGGELFVIPRARGLITATLFADDKHQTTPPVTTRITLSAGGMFGIKVHAANKIVTTSVAATIARIAAINTGHGAHIALLPMLAPPANIPSLSGDALIFRATKTGAHTVIAAVRATENTAPRTRIIKAITLTITAKN